MGREVTTWEVMRAVPARTCLPAVLWERSATDPAALGFHAIVCAGLSAAAPTFPRPPIRLTVSAAADLLVATILPVLKGAFAIC